MQHTTSKMGQFVSAFLYHRNHVLRKGIISQIVRLQIINSSNLVGLVVLLNFSSQLSTTSRSLRLCIIIDLMKQEERRHPIVKQPEKFGLVAYSCCNIYCSVSISAGLTINCQLRLPHSTQPVIMCSKLTIKTL